jgi:hypothetical protein
MRVAEVLRTPQGYCAAAGNFGFLRMPGEPCNDWHVLTLHLAYIAMAWGDHRDRDLREMAPPGETRAAALYVARRHAQELWQEAVARDLVPDLTQPSRFTPKTLAGFLSLQAIAALDALPTFRRCEFCYSWFAVGRVDQRFCQSKHRSLHYFREQKAS